ncbi:MAG: glycosyltransferase [Bacteroidia bacterium]
MQNPLVSIILPCYNEEDHLVESIHELNSVAKGFDFPYEFIFVEDGSSDSTCGELKKLQSARMPHSKFVYHGRNMGRGAAIKSGFAVAEGGIVGYIDIDLEISARFIGKMVEALPSHDVAVGKRSYFYKLSFQSIFRNILSRSYNRLSRLCLKHPFTDTETGFKFFFKDKVDSIIPNIENNQWFWDTEFMMEAYRNKLNVIEVPVEFIRNEKKNSTVRPWHDTFIYIRELIRYKKRRNT